MTVVAVDILLFDNRIIDDARMFVSCLEFDLAESSYVYICIAEYASHLLRTMYTAC